MSLQVYESTKLQSIIVFCRGNPLWLPFLNTTLRTPIKGIPTFSDHLKSREIFYFKLSPINSRKRG